MSVRRPEIPALADLGWSEHFTQQLNPSDHAALAPRRIGTVKRSSLLGIGPEGVQRLTPPAHENTGEYAVGDWVLADPATGRIARRLVRHSLLQRRAAGTHCAMQLIAANIDTLFIVTSCNADFNAARLERYLVLAAEAGVAPVILLTRADQGDAAPYLDQARALARAVPVAALNAKDPDAVETLGRWLGPGRTGALLGSSGVGKTTLMNALTGRAEATGGIREDDARGRHTTTARGLFAATGGGWLIDTPGMRAVRLSDVADGIDAVFSDLRDLAAQCKFTDCAHSAEPGCAVQAAISAGQIDAIRLERWRKLAQEETQIRDSLHSRKRDRSLQKQARAAKAQRKRRP